MRKCVPDININDVGVICHFCIICHCTCPQYGRPEADKHTQCYINDNNKILGYSGEIQQMPYSK